MDPVLLSMLRNQLLLKRSERWITESARPVSVDAVKAVPASDGVDALEGPKVKVVLITEGLGNRRDMNFYGPEAVDSAPAVFEGAHCFLNHPTYSEERDIPERRVQDMCGYFKNINVTVMEGMRTVVGELHFDLSETGRMAYDKTLTALHYQKEFPGADKEYVGLSINANGASEEREINLDGEQVVVHYVTQFTEAMSCDIVTLPARGGKFLALVESITGANMKNKEVRTMIVKRLQATQSALKEAMASAKTDEEKKPLSEALRNVEALLKEAIAAVSRSKTQRESETETESETESDKEEKSESDDASSGPVTTVKKTHTIVKRGSEAPKSGDEDADADDDEKEESETESETESEADLESEKCESNRLAVKQLIQESGLKASYFDEKDLATKGLREAKKEIARIKRISEANAKEMLELVAQVSPSHAAKLNESGKSGGKSSNNDLFSGCTL